MARRWVTVNSVDPRLPDDVVKATFPFFIADSAHTDLATVYAAAAAAGGGTIVVKGTFTLTAPLSIPSNTVSDWSDATILRGWSATVPVSQASKYTGAMIRQAGTSAENISIKGGFLAANGFDGPCLAMYGVTNLTLSDIDIDYTGAGDWAVTVSGTRINVSNVNPRGGSAIFEDGIHVHADAGVTVDGVNVNGCHVESGDDMVAITSSGSGVVRHVAAAGITGSSQSGFLFKVAVASAATGLIEQLTLAAGTALSGNTRNGGIEFINETADRQKMRHITVAGATLRTGNTATVNPRGIYVDCGYDIKFVGCAVNEFLWEQLYVDDVDVFRVVGCTFIGAASSALPVARILSSGAVSLDSSEFVSGSSATGAPIRFSAVENAAVRDCDILAIPSASQAAFFESACTAALITNNRTTRASTAAHGIRISAASDLDRLTIGGNDFDIGTGGFEIYPANLPALIRATTTQGTPVVVTLASDVLAVPAITRQVQVEGQSGAADNLATIQLLAGLGGYHGQEVVLLRGGEDITVKHGTGNIKTASAADVVMTATANTGLHFVYDGTNWVQV